jgi:hypothetical protein
VPGLLVEPPRPGLPARAGTRPTLSLPQIAAGAAAIALTLSSRGDALLLVVVLGALAAQPLRVAGVTGALVGSMLRWGTTSLGAIAGAQAVLGPAGWTGSSIAVASAWTGAAALVLAAPSAPRTERSTSSLPVRLAIVAPFGLAAGVLAVGPAPGGPLPLRAIAALIAIALSAVVSAARERHLAGRPVDLLVLASGVAAVLLGAAA